MTLKAAFIFLSPDAESKKHQNLIETPSVSLKVIGARDYKEAQALAKNLVKDGIKAIELCGGFGDGGVALMKQATAGKAAIGVVRFDTHPELNGKSGDALFG